jgi:hypothetical protein
MSQRLYELSRDIDRFEPFGVGEFGDGYLETNFNNWEEIESAFTAAIEIDLIGSEGVVIRKKQSDNLLHVIKAQMPAELVFIGFDDLFNYTDYPYLQNIRLWPIMSRRMLAALLSVGNFSHQIIPVIFKHVNSALSTQDERQSISAEDNHDFVIVQLLEYSDLFDRDKSDYTIEHSKNLVGEPVELMHVSEVVLKEPISGFPPIFRIKENETYLYVSVEAKEALEKFGIKGLSFSSFNIESS